MNGHASFNEVFLTDARLPVDHTVGPVGGGWAAALTTLAHERGLGQGPPREGSAPTSRAAREADAEAAEYARTYVWYPQRAGRADLAIPHARATGAAAAPVARQEVARLHAVERTARWTADRAAAARRSGKQPGAEGSIAKLAASEIARSCNAVHTHLAGAHAMLAPPDAHLDGVVAEVLVSTPAASIAGGTDEIQRNIVGERALGLPKEPSPDRTVPFRELRRNG